MKRQTYDGANLVTTAVAETFCLIIVLNSKKMFFNTSPVISTKSSVGKEFSCRLSKASLRP